LKTRQMVGPVTRAQTREMKRQKILEKVFSVKKVRTTTP
jgi:hypothetical protein